MYYRQNEILGILGYIKQKMDALNNCPNTTVNHEWGESWRKRIKKDVFIDDNFFIWFPILQSCNWFFFYKIHFQGNILLLGFH